MLRAVTSVDHACTTLQGLPGIRAATGVDSRMWSTITKRCHGQSDTCFVRVAWLCRHVVRYAGLLSMPAVHIHVCMS